MDVTIYHNPRCSKSRQTLRLLRERGIEPAIIEYLKTPPDEATLTRLVGHLGMTPRQIIRTGEADYANSGLSNPSLSDARIIAGLCRYPKLLQRPIVVRGSRARIGRPPEAVLEIL